MKPRFSQEYIKYKLDYNPETGEFFWKNPGANCLKPGQRAGGTRKSNGYVRITVNNVEYPAHVLAWLWMTGEWPENEIDHADQNPSNNKFYNLRPATRQLNQVNRTQLKNNTSGFKGVTWHKGAKKWIANIRANKKLIHLGYYEDIKEAAKVYNEAALKYYGEYAWLNKID